MQWVKKFVLIFVIMICIVLVGCLAERGDEKNMILDAGEDFILYSDEQLSEIAKLSGSMNDITDSYKTNYKTKVDVGYRVIYRGETKILMLIFDESENKVSSSFHDMTLNKDAFNMICVGSALSEVRAIDPQGDYLFIYAGSNDIPRVSMHYTMDGFVITITYDKNNMIEKIDIVPM